LDWATNVLSEVEAVELVGCVDEDRQALDKACSRGIVGVGDCFESLEAAFAKLEFDAVLVTTQLTGHAPVVRRALGAGKHVLVEKPFVQSLAEGEDLVALAESNNCTLMVSQNYRFFPAVRAVQEVVRAGALGQLLHVEVDFRRFSPPDPRKLARARSWAQPLLLDMSVHHFDLLRAIIPGHPHTVYCRSWNPPWSGYSEAAEATAMISFGDLVVSYRASWLHPGPTTAWAGEWRMEFEEGELWWSSRGDLSNQRHATGDEVWVHTPKSGRTSVELPRLEFIDRAGALAAFAESVASGTVPESSGTDNLGSLALVYAAVQSAARRQPVDLPEQPGQIATISCGTTAATLGNGPWNIGGCRSGHLRPEVPPCQDGQGGTIEQG
jgi:predicted dehydrogenase